MKVMFSVGEASGDLNGASLAAALKLIQPGVRLYGLGGDQMRAAGIEILFDNKVLGVMGLVEPLLKLPGIFRLRRAMAELMDSERPDVLVVIDSGGFNIPLAKIAKSKGIPVVYYIPPKTWLYGRGRAKKIAATVDRVATIFDFENKAYEEAGAKVTFVGHPLLEIVKPTLSKSAAYEYFGARADKPVVLLMPGSRNQEITSLLPVMLAAVEKIRKHIPDCQFYLPVAPTISSDKIKKIVADYSAPVTLTQDKTYDLMQISQVAIAASGTATLETSLMLLPTVIIYRLSKLTYSIAKMFVNLPYYGLPNIIAGRGVVPELIQEQVNADQIAEETLDILTDLTVYSRILADLGEVRHRLGECGAVDKVAKIIIEVAIAKTGGQT
jgi:lipid-A-disaccharide synthase